MRQSKKSAGGVHALRAHLEGLSHDSEWSILDPLPPTRILGQNFGVSNVSAFRVLTELRNSGALWQAPNGRHYLAAAQRLIEKPPPLACLLRRLQGWTQVIRNVIEGADEACGANDRAILLVHDKALFAQADRTSPATAGSREAIRDALEDFLLLHGERTSGIILDELWPDSILAEFEGRLERGVVVYRHTKLPFLGALSANTQSAARIITDLATRRNSTELVIVSPYTGYPPSDEMLRAVRQAANRTQIPCRHTFLLSEEFPQLLADQLQNPNARPLLVATEDNAAVAVLGILQNLGWTHPNRIGLASTMGSQIALSAGITSACFDFREIGRQAAMMAMDGSLAKRSLPATLAQGHTA